MSGGWNTIESDAGVFTSLVESLGVKDVQFEELLSLDPDALAQLHPVHGVIFLFRVPTEGAADEKPAGRDDGATPPDGVYDHDAADRIFFAHQTIQNACATQAVLSVLLNRTGAGGVDVGPDLASFREFAMALPADLRGEALSNSELIRTVHNSFARASPFVDETAKPPAGPDDDAEDLYHFIAYSCLEGRLYELDGLRPAPVSHGACAGADFPARVVEVLQRRVARHGAAEIRFNLLAVVRDLRARAREFGDTEALAREEDRRRGWRFENALRRHNFVGFSAEVLRRVVVAKLGEEKTRAGHPTGPQAGYQAWIDEALSRQKQLEEKRKSRRAAEGEQWEGGGDVDMG